MKLQSLVKYSYVWSVHTAVNNTYMECVNIPDTVKNSMW